MCVCRLHDACTVQQTVNMYCKDEKNQKSVADVMEYVKQRLNDAKLGIPGDELIRNSQLS